MSGMMQQNIPRGVRGIGMLQQQQQQQHRPMMTPNMVRKCRITRTTI